MNLEEVRKIKAKLKQLINDTNVIDIILFGSYVKGKANPRDIDLALIVREKKSYIYEGFHVSIITANEWFTNHPSLATTLLREGYSIKNNKYLAESLLFKPKALYSYKLNNLNNSKKVRIVQILRGNKKEKGMIEKYNGEWLSNQVFIIPPEADSLFERFFTYQEINFEKKYILIH